MFVRRVLRAARKECGIHNVGIPRMSAKASLGVPSLFAQRLGSPNRDVGQTTFQHLLTRSLPRSQQMFIQARRCPSPVADRTHAHHFSSSHIAKFRDTSRHDDEHSYAGYRRTNTGRLRKRQPIIRTLTTHVPDQQKPAGKSATEEA
jgi:hypothetical protein